jgi:hypothetical protein
MGTEAFDTKIGEIEQRITREREAAETAMVAFLTATAAEVKALADSHVKTFVQNEHETTKKLGNEKLSALKSALAKLQDKIPSLVEKALALDDVWPHRVGHDPKKLFESERDFTVWRDDKDLKPDNGPAPLQSRIENLLQKELCGLVEAHGYTIPVSRHSSDRRFPGLWFKFSVPMLLALKRYGEANKKLQDSVRELANVNDAKGKSIAADLWNKA